MLNLIGFFENFVEIVPIILMPLIFVGIVITIIVVAVVRRVRAEQRAEAIERAQSSTFLDGNGRTSHQSEYLAAKRRELAERKVTANDGSHEHLGGKVEKYDKIVGSLGEVNDEGCDELDGVRLIEHDEFYCDDPDHILSSDQTDLERAIVLGEVLNAPRFKTPYRHK